MPKIPVYAYARYSSDNQRGESIETQLQYIHDYAAANDCEVMGVYADKATSGTHTEGRTEFLRMIADIKNRRQKIAAVLVWDITRYARNSEEAISTENMLLRLGIEIISVTQPMRTKKDDGRINTFALTMRRIQHIFAESGSFQNSDQTSAHMYSQSQRGNENGHHPHLAGPAPYGYKIGARKHYKDHKYLEIDETEAPAVRLAWSMVDQGVGYRTIAEKLTEMGYRTRKGDALSHTLIFEIVHHPVYAGIYVYGKIRYNRITTGQAEENPDATVISDGVPAIIGAELYTRVTEKLNRRRHTPQETTKHTYILSGHAHCGYCGSPMNGDSTSAKRTPCYRCGGKECSHKHWRTGKLGFEETVINIMWTRFFLGVKAEDIEEALSMFEKNETKELKKTIEKLSKKIRSEEDALNGLIDAMADPDIRALTKPRVLKKQQELIAMKSEYDTKKQAYHTIQTQCQANQIQSVLEQGSRAYRVWDEKALRQITSLFIKNIELTKESIKIIWVIGETTTIDTTKPDPPDNDSPQPPKRNKITHTPPSQTDPPTGINSQVPRDCHYSPVVMLIGTLLGSGNR